MNPVKVVTIIVSAVLFLIGLLLTGWSLTLGPHWGMFVSCLALTVLLGVFVYYDVLYLKKYFAEKSDNDSV